MASYFETQESARAEEEQQDDDDETVDDEDHDMDIQNNDHERAATLGIAFSLQLQVLVHLKRKCTYSRRGLS